MIIRKDMQYITSTDRLGIENGYAKLDYYGLRLSAHASAPEKVLAVVKALNGQFIIHNFDDDKSGLIHFNSKWDLYFWCNWNQDAGTRDYSYVTLNFNKKHMTYEERAETYQKVADFIFTLDTDIDIVCQYCGLWDDEKVSETVTAFCENNLDKMIQYTTTVGEFLPVSLTGKIRKLPNGGYGFFKKGAKRYGTRIEPNDKCILSLAINGKVAC